MLSLSTMIETLDGTILTMQELINQANDDIENHVYTCDLNGYIKPTKIISGSISKENSIQLLFNDGLKVICTEDHEFPVQSVGYKKAKELTSSDFVAGCHFNNDNTLIYEHNSKIFLQSDYIVNECYNLYPLLYQPRNILDLLPLNSDSIRHHLWVISTITINKDQLCNRLANDTILKDMIGVDYLTYDEVSIILNQLKIEISQRILTECEHDLVQLLNIHTPDHDCDRSEGLLASLKEYNGDLFQQCGILVEGELTMSHLLEATRLVGYSNPDHLTSVKHLHGSRVIQISPVLNADVGMLILNHGETIGLHNGVFAKT